MTTTVARAAARSKAGVTKANGTPRAVQAEIVRITPEMATKMLEGNAVNRHLRVNLIETYRRDMEQGRWDMTGEPVQFSRSGRLLNGQHRLTALAGSTCKGIDLLVVSGLADQAQMMMDQGAARGVLDALRMKHGDLKNMAVVSVVSRWLVAHPQPGLPNMVSDLKHKVSASEAVAAFEAAPDEIAHAASRAAGLKQSIPGSSSGLAYTYFHLHRFSPPACEEFFGAMHDMAFSVKADPRKAALRRLQIIQGDPTARATTETAVVVVSVHTRAFNAWRRGEEMAQILARNSRGQVIPPVNPE